jgi:hypothetical protein
MRDLSFTTPEELMTITDRWGDKHYVRRNDFEHGKR